MKQPNERDLLADLADHGDREIEALRAYRSLLDDVEDPAVRYLVEVVLDDERRHHRFIADMIEAIRQDVDFQDIDFDDGEPALPLVQRYPAQSTVGQVLRMHVEGLLEVEEADRDSLRQAMRDLAARGENSLLTVLVRLMLVDTEKHIAILNYIGGLVDPSAFDVGTLFEPVLLAELTASG